jgi:hypothetical protein
MRTKPCSPSSRKPGANTRPACALAGTAAAIHHQQLATISQSLGSTRSSSKLHALVPRGEEDQLLEQKQAGQELIAVEAQHQTLIAEYLADKNVGKARKAKDAELDLNAQIAGMLAGRKVELHAGLASGADDLLALSASA